MAEVAFGWVGALTVDGQEISISDYPRFDNPYATVEFDSLLHQIEYDGMSLLLDFEQGLREMK